jgi:hypothetical protein
MMDTFYDVRELSLTQKVALIKDCMEICFHWWTDKLDCSESFARQRIDMTFEEIMTKFGDSAHFVVIDRDFFMLNEKKHFEIGFRAMSGIDYFLFIWIEDEKMPVIIEKYNLKPMVH